MGLAGTSALRLTTCTDTTPPLQTAEHLAVMVINICRIVDPEVIVFGGGLAAAGDALLEPIRRYPFPSCP